MTLGELYLSMFIIYDSDSLGVLSTTCSNSPFSILSIVPYFSLNSLTPSIKISI